MHPRDCVRSRRVCSRAALGVRALRVAMSLALVAVAACDDTENLAGRVTDAEVATGGRPSVTDQGAGGGAGGRLDLALVDLGIPMAAGRFEHPRPTVRWSFGVLVAPQRAAQPIRAGWRR